jgi:hypothetical protein
MNTSIYAEEIQTICVCPYCFSTKLYSGIHFYECYSCNKKFARSLEINFDEYKKFIRKKKIKRLLNE